MLGRIHASAVAAVVALAAVMTLAAEAPIRFASVAAAAGLTVVNIAGSPSKDYLLDSIGTGVAWLDCDSSP
jgi:hypothetical protein